MNDEQAEGSGTAPGRVQRYRELVERFAARALARLDVLRGRSAAIDVAVVVSERDRHSAGALLAGALAFRFFAVLIPFVVVWVAIVGFSAGSGSTSSVVHKIGLTGYVAASVSQAARLSTGGKWAVIVVGLFALVWASLSALRTMRTAFAIAWGMPVRRWGKSLSGALVFILVLHVAFALVTAANALRNHSPAGGLAALIFLTAVFFVLWLYVSRLLPHAGTDWRSLMPGAVFVAIGVQVLQFVTIFLIWRVTRTSAFYGPLGLAIVMLLWLYLVARVLIASALLNAQIWERRTGLAPQVASDARLRGSGAAAVWTSATPPGPTPESSLLTGADTGDEADQASRRIVGAAAMSAAAARPSTPAPSASTIAATSALRRPDRMEVPMAKDSDEKAAEPPVNDEQSASADAVAPEPAETSAETPQEPAAAGDESTTAAGEASAAADAETTVVDESPAAEVTAAQPLETVDELPVMEPSPVPAPPRPESGGGGTPPKSHRRLRAWIALSLVILAVITALVTSIAFWAHGLLFNTDKFVTTVAPVMKEPQVQKRLATRIVDETIAVTDLQQRLDNVLPPRLKFLAGPLTDQIDTRLTHRMQQVFASQRFYNLWERILTRAHETMVAVLNGDSKVIQLQGDKVVLSTVPLMAAALDKLGQILPNVIAKHIPTIDPTLPVDQQKAQLEAAIGRPIPDKYATIQLYQSDQVATAQKAVHLFNVLVWALLAITLALIAGALIVSPRRLRTLIQLGIGAVVVVAVVSVAVNRLEASLINGSKVKGTGLASIFTRITDNLTGYILWLLIGGAILTVIAYLATRPKWARQSYESSKRLVSSGAQAGGRVVGQAGEHRAPAQAWIARHLDGLRVGGVVVGVLILLLTMPGLGGGLAIIIIFAAYEFLITYLGRPVQTE